MLFGTALQSFGRVGSKLEELEGLLGNAVQRQESRELRRLYLQEPILSALGSRARRQQEKVSFEVTFFHIQDKASADSFHALMQVCSKISGMELVLKISSNGIGRDVDQGTAAAPA